LKNGVFIKQNVIHAITIKLLIAVSLDIIYEIKWKPYLLHRMDWMEMENKSVDSNVIERNEIFNWNGAIIVFIFI